MGPRLCGKVAVWGPVGLTVGPIWKGLSVVCGVIPEMLGR